MKERRGPEDKHRVKAMTGKQEPTEQNGPIKYSICITSRNDFSTVRASLESILAQLDDSFEVVIVDACSTDGTLEVLREYASKNKIRLIVKKCNRGRGRQLALANSTGEYVVANMDLDDLFEPNIVDFLDLYHRDYEGKMLRIIRSNGKHTSVNVAPSSLLMSLGGWRDVQYFEDVDLWQRAKKNGAFVEIAEFPIQKVRGDSLERRGIVGRLRFRLVADRDKIRLNLPRWHARKNSLQYGISWLAAKFAGEPDYIPFSESES